MSKRGIALETAVGLIIGIIFLVIVIFIILRTGVLAVFQAQLFGVICTASAYSRGILVGIILWIWKIVSIAIEIVIMFSGIKAGAKLAGKAASKQLLTLLQQIKLYGKYALGMGSLFGLIGFLSVSIILTYATILPLLSNIPLICPTVTIDVGTYDKHAPKEKLFSELSGATIDCWNMYGSGSMDPLIALDPPNPKECRIIETYLDSQTNVSEIYDYMREKYDKTWPLGDDKLFVYCNLKNDKEKLYNNPDEWKDKCSFTNATIYIMFRDKHDYDLISYGTNVCGGQIDAGDFGDKGDVMVWCIEDI